MFAHLLKGRGIVCALWDAGWLGEAGCPGLA